jgi:ATP-binding cassette subfamily B protein
VLAVIGLGVWAISAGRVTLSQFLALTAFLGRRPLQRRDPGSVGFAVQPGGLVLTRALTAPAPTGDGRRHRDPALLKP